jgi:hypothetical protein
LSARYWFQAKLIQTRNKSRYTKTNKKNTALNKPRYTKNKQKYTGITYQNKQISNKDKPNNSWYFFDLLSLEIFIRVMLSALESKFLKLF